MSSIYSVYNPIVESMFLNPCSCDHAPAVGWMGKNAALCENIGHTYNTIGAGRIGGEINTPTPTPWPF